MWEGEKKLKLSNLTKGPHSSLRAFQAWKKCSEFVYNKILWDNKVNMESKKVIINDDKNHTAFLGWCKTDRCTYYLLPP